jgi:hypothetical protein
MNSTISLAFKVVRELQTGQTLRSGWLSEQGQTAFENFLGPIAEQGLQVAAVLSDKQRGLVPAVAVVFPHTKHAFCQSHYLANIAEPVAQADEAMKVSLRKGIREAIGDLIRPEQVERAGVVTITGLLPSPINPEPARLETEPGPPVCVEQEQVELETAFKRRVRYLLTLELVVVGVPCSIES